MSQKEGRVSEGRLLGNRTCRNCVALMQNQVGTKNVFWSSKPYKNAPKYSRYLGLCSSGSKMYRKIRPKYPAMSSQQNAKKIHGQSVCRAGTTSGSRIWSMTLLMCACARCSVPTRPQTQSGSSFAKNTHTHLNISAAAFCQGKK